MKQTIKQSSLIILAGIMTLAFGCDSTGPGVTPLTISGKTVIGAVTTGTGDLEPPPGGTASANWIGTFSDSTFTSVGTGPPSSDDGSYTYLKTSQTTATLTTITSDGTLTILLTFSSATAGTYSATGSGTITGTQSGTFTTN